MRSWSSLLGNDWVGGWTLLMDLVAVKPPTKVITITHTVIAINKYNEKKVLFLEMLEGGWLLYMDIAFGLQLSPLTSQPPTWSLPHCEDWLLTMQFYLACLRTKIDPIISLSCEEFVSLQGNH